MRLRSKYQIHDNVAYFLDQIKEISKQNWKPNMEDFIRIRTRSTGFSMWRIRENIGDYGEYQFELIDVGGARAERKKWMKTISGMFLGSIEHLSMKMCVVFIKIIWTNNRSNPGCYICGSNIRI